MQLDIRPGMTNQDIELMKKELEEEILSQIQNNQQLLQDSKTPWESKVRSVAKLLRHFDLEGRKSAPGNPSCVSD